MNRVSSLIIISSLTILANCKSEDPGIDCSNSDLSLEVIDFVKSDCNAPGSVSVFASGGEGDYTFSIDDDDFKESSVFEGLFSSDFTFSVKDEKGCIVSIPFRLESEPTGITLSLQADRSNCTSNTGSIIAEASGGVGTLQFSINGSGFAESNEFVNIGAGDYSVTVRDEEGCRVNKSIKVLTNTSLSNDIMPIINKDCAISGCHNGSQSPRLITATEVIANASRIKSETQAGSMPRGRTLTQSEIDLIACWVDDGAIDN